MPDRPPHEARWATAPADPPVQVAWEAPAPARAPGLYWPPAWAPTKDQLTYTKEAATVLLLVLALPWLVLQLLRDPRGLIAMRGQKMAEKGAP